MSDIENRLKRLENIVQDQREEISDLKATVSDLQVQLGKIQIRDLLSAFGQMFCRRVGGLYKDPVLVERQPGQESWQTVNFTKTSNMSLLLKELDEHKGRLPLNIQTALEELEELCGSDPVALARYCHEHQGDRSEWNAMAHPLLKYLATENRDNEQLRGEAETVIQNFSIELKQCISYINFIYKKSTRKTIF
ncbi:hypothetical protein MIR68_001715 [Amoeboaphelidium protococcarum]|nr:hypothetical protein MIR68_001715 [Amoeboaphelidium protococcarum]